MNPITQVILTVVTTVLFGLMIRYYCKRPNKAKVANKEESSVEKVVNISSFKERTYKNNLQMFLDADEALANQQDAQGMAMYMKAMSSAKRLFANEKGEEKRAS